MPKTWYTIKALANDSVEIDIFDEIGFWGITAKDFIATLKKYPDAKNITLRINSPGGSVFDGIAIYNSLKRHPANVIGVVYGIAASIASVILMSADKVVMPENTFLFIHDPLALVIGDADDMREMADDLEKIASGLITSYAAKTGKEEKEIKKWMAEDTWFTAAEALDAGLADEVTTAVKIAASASLARFNNLPEVLKPLAIEKVEVEADPESKPQPEPKPAPATEAEVEAKVKDAAKAAAERARAIVELCAKAGVADAAANFLEKNVSVDDVRARLADADKIRARCTAAKLPDRANAYIKAGMSVKEVADDLFDVLLARQGAEIDNKLGPDGERRERAPAPVIDINAIYRKRNQKR